MTTILESNLPNLENEFLKGLRNRTVIGDIQSQVVAKSKFLKHIQILHNKGDTIKIIGLKSNKPKKFTWDYEEKKFGPNDTVTYNERITDDDKLIFYTVFSEPIEEIAVGDRIHDTIAKQTEQVSSDIADYYDEEFVQKYACDLTRYHDNAVVRLNAEQMRDIQLVGQILITNGYRMTSPSTLFNKREERCNVTNTKKLLCFIDVSLYGVGQLSSVYKAPSPTIELLEKVFTVIPCSMVGDVKVALIDSGGLYLWDIINKRYLKSDEYVAAHKLLDHIWRKWIFVDYRPAFAIVFDEKAKNKEYDGFSIKEKSEEDDLYSDSPQENIEIDTYLEELKDKFDPFIKDNSSEGVKPNIGAFLINVNKRLGKFTLRDLKPKLNSLLTELKPDESDTDATTRFGRIIESWKTANFIDK